MSTRLALLLMMAAAPTSTSTTTTTTTPAPPARGGRPVAPLVAEVLAPERYEFCHDNHYPLTGGELAWCPLIAEGDKVCPAFKKACARGAQAQQDGWQDNKSFELPALPALGRGMLIALLIVLGVLLVGFLIKQFIDHRAGPRSDRPARAPREPGTRDDDGAAARALETDVNRLLDRARAAAAAGDYGRAIAETYAALLRKLEGCRLTRVEPYRTNGDYLIDLRAHLPALRPRVAAVIAEVEQVEFGGAAPEEHRFRLIHDRVVGICAEHLAPLALLLLFALPVLLSGCRRPRADWEDSPSGRSALIALLQKNGFEVRERLAPLHKIGDEVDTLVLLPGAPVTDEDWAALDGWVSDDGGTLIIAGSERPLPPWIEASFASAQPGPSSLLLAKAATQRWGPLHVVSPPGSSAVESKGARRLLSRARSRYAVDLAYGDGRIAVFADDRLFCNAALLLGDDASFVVRLLNEGGDHVQFAGELLGAVSQSPVAAVIRGRLAPSLLQLALLAALFFLAKGAYFGRPHDPESAGRRVFADHARALGLNYARAHAGRLSLELYAAWALERLRERLRLGGSRTLSALAEGVAARTGRSTGAVMHLFLEARDANPSAPVGNAAAERSANTEALATQRHLAQLLDEVGGPSPRAASGGVTAAGAAVAAGASGAPTLASPPSQR